MLKGILAILFAVTLLLGAAHSVYAQPVAEKPDFRAGDAWQFLATDAKDGKTRGWTRTIEAIELPDRIAVKAGGVTAYYDSALNLLRGGRADAARVLVRYPLRVGDEWTFSIRFEKSNLEESGRARVAAYESVSVPAGTFQCYRVEAESTYGTKFYTEYRTWSRWYCPEIKWLAKEVVTTWTRSVTNPANNSETTVSSVLIKFKSGS